MRDSHMTDSFLRGSIIRKYRKHKGYTIEELAELTELSPRYVSDIELRNKGMSLQTFEKMCKVLDIPPDYLLSGKEILYSDEQLRILEIAESLPEEKRQYFIETLKNLVLMMK